MKKVIGFLFLLFMPIFMASSQGSGLVSTDIATVDSWYRMLDTVFCFEQLNLPEQDIPVGLTRPYLRRAWTLGITFWSNDADADIPLQIWVVRSSMMSLFWRDMYEWNPLSYEIWYSVRDRLWNYGIKFDSVETSARGVGYYSSNPEDQVHAATLRYFANVAMQTPLVIIPAVQWTAGDGTKLNVRVMRNKSMIAGFRTILSGWPNFADIQNPLSGYFQTTVSRSDAYNSNGWYKTSFAVGGIAPPGADVIKNDFVATELSYVPHYIGTVNLSQERPIVADTLGEKDKLVWGMETILRSFDRADVNQDFQVTISDAVKAARMILYEEEPSLFHLGDANYSGSFDPDDPLAILNIGLWGGGYGEGRGKIVAKQEEVPPTKGTLSPAISKTGNEISLSISFNGEVNNAKRFASQISFDTSMVKFEGASFEQEVETMSGTLAKETKVNILAYPKNMGAGKIVTLKFLQVGSSVGVFKLSPLKGDNFFVSNEIVQVENTPEVTGVGDKKVLPDNFALNQNYPNPFNPTTTISYSIPKESYMKLEVFDLTGRSIKVLADGLKAAGNHSVSFDGSGLASGMYFYRIQAGEFTGIKKMVLMK